MDTWRSVLEYRWRGADAHGRDVGTTERMFFVEQTEAETWLSENWTDLLESGVETVTLLHGEAEVYGPMSLRAAS